MRTAIFSFILLAAPALLAQTFGQTAADPNAQLWAPPAQDSALHLDPGTVTVLNLPSSSLTIQNASPLTLPSPSPLVGQNNGFSFVLPRPAAPVAKMEPIPTQWPNAKFESLPTHWNNVRMVPLGASGTPAASAPAVTANPIPRR